MATLDDLLKTYHQVPDSQAAVSAKPRVLVIDDDPSLRRGLERSLAPSYRVVAVTSGEEGVEQVDPAFHCIVLDVKMKGLNGFETYRKLKEKCADIPIIFYTAFQSEHDLKAVINEYKPDGYVEKGSDIGVLKLLIAQATSKYQAVLEKEKYKTQLEETITALKVMIQLREADKSRLERDVLATVSEMVLPYVEKLKSSVRTPNARTYLDLIETNLNQIVSPFVRTLSTYYYKLTAKEIEIAQLIKNGKATKEIADILNVSIKTVEFHRNNIRKKLGIKNAAVNLRTHLTTIIEK